MIVVVMYARIFEVDFPAAYSFDAPMALVSSILGHDLLYGGVPLLMHVSHHILLAELIQLVHVLLHLDCFEHLVLLGNELLLKLFFLFHFHELADFTLLYH